MAVSHDFMKSTSRFVRGLHRYLQDKGIKRSIEVELEGIQPVLARSLLGRSDVGILVFVSIYRGSEGQKRFDAVLVLGEGTTPAAAFRRSVQIGWIRSAPPKGMLPDEMSSFMIWYRAEGGLIVGETISFPYWKTIARGEDLDATGKQPMAHPQIGLRSPR